MVFLHFLFYTNTFCTNTMNTQMKSSQAYSIWRAAAFAACLPLLALSFAACSDGREVARDEQTADNQTAEDQTAQARRSVDGKDAVREDSVQEDSVQEEMTAFASGAETALGEADQDLEQIGQRIENVGEDGATEMQSALQGKLQALRQRRDSLQTDLDRLTAQEGEEAREMRDELDERMIEYKRDLRTVRLESIESKEEFVDAARTEMQEIGEQVEQMQQRLSQMDSTRISGMEDTMGDALSEFNVEREQLETNLQDVIGSRSDEFADARAAMAEVIAALRSKVDQASRKVEGMDPRSKATSMWGGE